MNGYELALNNIIDAIEMLNRHIEDGSFNHPYWSIGKIRELIDNSKKYRWHDLRKNPEDLPKCDGDYMCRVGARKYPERPMTYEPFDLRADGENKWRDFGGYVYDHFVLAWREIEPFEEGE